MANISENLIDTTISNADVTALNTALTTAATTLDPYMATLTEEERNSLFSLQQENLVFATDALLQIQSLGSLLPPALGSLVTDLSNDLALHEQLKTVEQVHLNQLIQKVADTKRLAAHEAYTGALAAYKVIEALASVGVPGAQAAYDILKVRFANQGGRPVTPPTP